MQCPKCGRRPGTGKSHLGFAIGAIFLGGIPISFSLPTTSLRHYIWRRCVVRVGVWLLGDSEEKAEIGKTRNA